MLAKGSLVSALRCSVSPSTEESHHIHRRVSERFTYSRTGIDQPNNLSNNLMSAISTRTGVPVSIRVGGTSMDNTIFNASNPAPLTPTGDEAVCGINTNRTIGSPWLSAFKSFNPGTRFTVELPLARHDPVNRTVFAQACIAAMPDQIQQLDAIEIGNEPDLYPLFPQPPCGPDRPSSYGPDDYAAQWKGAVNNLSKQVGALKGQKAWYQALTFSSGVNQKIWNLTSTYGWTLDSQNYSYQTKAYQLMNHSITVSEMQSAFGTAISFLKTKRIPFILGEVGSALGVDNCTPNPELYGSLGGALWTADFMLHAMTMGINRVSMQQVTNTNFSAWQPVTTPGVPKAMRGNWYGFVYAADFIGSGGNFQVQPLPIHTSHPNIVSYAGYNLGQLTKLAMLDMEFWNGVNDTGRPAVNIELADLDANITGVRVSRLTAPGGSKELENISWAGRQWSADNDGQEPKGNNSVLVKVANGSLAGNVTILASQALLLEMVRV
ncbi:hypothetical protein DFH07DRAFT_755558 [Mycena maculata]|uniref:Beta-glucuronidase C-terminal domain-containing protein n=1 Tax=Mycena maculata TaxID=230809 RepID=A0AAD7HZ72_9AGAR|nr:hypothetical protein DFH07DRAFT_755558 [Mycena maculata]